MELTVRHSASRGVVSQRDLTKMVERFNSGAGTSTLDLLIPMDLKFREAVGFSVGGGQYQPVVPGDTAIYVAYISPDSAIGRSGQLQIGDRIDEINGECVAKVSHTAFKYAFKANSKELAMKVTRVEGAVSDAPLSCVAMNYFLEVPRTVAAARSFLALPKFGAALR